jgi:hypothetical protein
MFKHLNFEKIQPKDISLMEATLRLNLKVSRLSVRIRHISFFSFLNSHSIIQFLSKQLKSAFEPCLKRQKKHYFYSKND